MRPVAEQIISFLLLVILGGLVGFIYDIYRTVRRVWQPKYWGTLFGDTLFWLLITVISYAFLLLSNWGEVRLYVFLAMGLGFSAYLRCLSKPVLRRMFKAYLTVSMIFSYIFKIFRRIFPL